MRKVDYKSSAGGRRVAEKNYDNNSRDEDKLSDDIFLQTGVQAQVYMHHGAVHLTVKTLGDYFVARSFLVNLSHATNDTRARNQSGVAFYLWHATATQRAEAFLRTLNLWED